MNKSDSTGGAAIVSRRLLEALRSQGVEARMLVTEKLSDNPYVELAANPFIIKFKFLIERLRIFIANGFKRKTLFQIDTGETGLPLWRNKYIKEADAVLLNWVNQGMLSLKGVRKIMKRGPKVIWTMHDMWCFTGICHHAATCKHYLRECGDCPLLGKKGSGQDLSFKIHRRKKSLYSMPEKITFVAVSNWIKDKGAGSSLLSNQHIEVIANAFPLPSLPAKRNPLSPGDKIRILFGAARIDDPIKGLDTLRAVSQYLAEKPNLSSHIELAFFGSIKNPEALEGFGLPVVNLGTLNGEEAVTKAYKEAHILVSASSYETLPGTLVEAQAYGCIPVAFNQGGQPDIVEDGVTGYLCRYSQDPGQRAENLARGITSAIQILRDPVNYPLWINNMYRSVKEKFDYSLIAKKYISLVSQA